MTIVYAHSRCRTFGECGVDASCGGFTPLPSRHDRTDKIRGICLACSTAPLYKGILYKVEKPTLDDRLHEGIRRAISDTGRQASVQELLQQFG